MNAIDPADQPLADEIVDAAPAPPRPVFTQRSYDLAAAMLHDLGVSSVRLMTNNPQKLDGLRRAGVPVVEHEPHWVETSTHSEEYLAVKRRKLGHIA